MPTRYGARPAKSLPSGWPNRIGLVYERTKWRRNVASKGWEDLDVRFEACAFKITGSRGGGGDGRARRIRGLKKGTHLSEKSSHTGKGSNEAYRCVVKHGKLKLTIYTSAFFRRLRRPGEVL